MAKGEKTQKKYDRASKWMLYATLGFAAAGFFVAGRAIWIETVWEPDPRCLNMREFTSQTYRRTIKPQRGNILDCNGRLLAITLPTYRVELDCSIHKALYESQTQPSDSIPGKTVGEVKEGKWRKKARKLAKGLPGILNDGRDAAWFEKEMTRLRDSGGKAGRNLKIAEDVDYATLQKIRKLPLADEGRYSGGVIVTPKYGRDYPYGKLARRTIGYVRNNDEGSTARGIEGSFNYELHGEPGVEWLRMADGKELVIETDSVSVPVKDGNDIRLTLDIDLQDIADEAVRKYIEDDENITDACMIVMEVKTGAIKAMVNLHKGKNGKFDETQNIALTQATCPGSVFKTVGLMTLLEDGKTTLETRLNLDMLQKLPKPFEKEDDYLVKFKNRTGKSSISVLEGLEISSNHVFTWLALENYRSNPKEFMSRYYDYGFGTDWQFDITGMAPCVIPDPDSKRWTYSDLGTAAYGYSVEVTPLHTLAFYNAIANGGNLMKPYIVDAVLKDGKVVRQAKPVSMNRSICSKATADTLKRALRRVVTDGTGSALKNARCDVAGKTGTSRIIVPKDVRSKGDAYMSVDGKRRHQGSFAGFFPAEDPVYSAIVVVYSGLSRTSYYGGTRPARALREVIDELYSMDPRWRKEIDCREAMPGRSGKLAVADRKAPECVPNVVGMGLNEAIYTIENSGYQCRFSGVGHVRNQSPAAGKTLKKGETVTVTLQ